MMIDRLAGNAALKDSVRLMLGSRRLTHSVLLVGETGRGRGLRGPVHGGRPSLSGRRRTC